MLLQLSACRMVLSFDLPISVEVLRWWCHVFHGKHGTQNCEQFTSELYSIVCYDVEKYAILD